MLVLPFSGLSSQKMTCSIANASMGFSGICRLGFDFNRNEERKKKGKFSLVGLADSPAYTADQKIPPPNIYHDVLKVAREKFTQEISFRSKDKDISLAKALLYVAAEDEAFMAYNREMDARSLENERRGASGASISQEWDTIDAMPLAGKNISQWLEELDAIAKEVQAELVSRDIGCHLVEVLEAVNIVLFESRGFQRSPVMVDSKCSYMHSVLSSGRGSAIMLSIIYIEVCRRLNLNIVGSRVGEDFLIWPQTGNPEELFKISSGRSLFGVVNGRCVEDPRSKASDLNSDTLLGLDIATNRDIIGIALANMIRLHWKRASRTNHGLMLTSPLRRVYNANDKFNQSESSDVPLLRPRDLRLAIMASEKLLILQPHNWALRRDHGMMLYFYRDYEEAVQELSICMAFAPEEEAQVLEPFVEKLHLLRLESSWKSLGHKGRLTVT
ncbi:Tetratricopeptide-like helical domain, Protein SirB1 [Heracleum sosnowskyi]|uniref:Tetratricopeptide-like helical domain, Protein SirB1 n=1 Tax=Heracleum sosnowskyi TaxID=360622 RepID=A0AAD8MND5_9APIA|nr:Tetratricopeptide-like helical domain, Protein SirB1 [Heracleum sosnowskyi]